MAALRALRALPVTPVTLSSRQSVRSYASAPQSSGAFSWPAIAAVAGVVGLGVYTFLPADKVEKIEDKAKGVAAEVQAAKQGTGSWGALIKDKWVPFELASVEPYNHNTKVYHFKFPEDSKDKVSGIPVAGALLVKMPEGENEVKDDKGKPVIRPYTPISTSEQAGSLTLLIKEYKDGKLTPYISSLQIGQPLLFKGPIVKYKYEPNTFERGLCIAGGSGITPMWQLIKHSLDQPEDKTKWTLIFSNVSEQDILLRKEWDELASKHSDRLKVNYVLDKGPRGWKGETGFVTAPIISKLFPRQEGEKVKAFVCGPPPQVNSVSGGKDGPRQGELKGALKELGYTEEEVFKF
ncbi:putative cytochrome-b5 reductase [Papiliotrema laurentii]|uniref:NADH-cytochrome b5 reductase n=1 Tax=Papiliotrema laurentii TaxID=5418 RepID=A0AAD9D1N6_PAPLA|nr:putative cytochrome-b5 reductase [Papiliotrema laurentii]